MQLKIQRSQKSGLTGAIIFCLDVRADYTAEEQDNIRKYRLAGQGLYNSRAATRHLDAAGAHLAQTQSGDLKHRAGGLIKGAASLALSRMHLSVSIGSIAKGHHIECKDLEELLEAEDTLRAACRNLTRYLEVANTFNGSEVVVDYVGGEEQVRVAQNVPPLLQQSAAAGGQSRALSANQSHMAPVSRPTSDAVYMDERAEFEPIAIAIAAWWSATEGRLTAFLNNRPLFARAGIKLDVVETRIVCVVSAILLIALVLIIV